MQTSRDTTTGIALSCKLAPDPQYPQTVGRLPSVDSMPIDCSLVNGFTRFTHFARLRISSLGDFKTRYLLSFCGNICFQRGINGVYRVQHVQCGTTTRPKNT